MAAVTEEFPEANPLYTATRPSIAIAEDQNSEEPLYSAAGFVVIDRQPVRYEFTGSESADQSNVTAIFNGLGGFDDAYVHLSRAIVQQRDSYCIRFTPVRNSGLRKNLFMPQTAQVKALEAILQDAPSNPAVSQLPQGRRISFDSLVIAPHSMGLLPGVKFAESHSGKIVRMEAYTPAGLNRGQAARHVCHFLMNTPGLVTKDLVSICESPFIDNDPKLALKALIKFIEHNRRGDRLAGEIVSILFSNYAGAVQDIGAPTLCLEADEDRLVPGRSSAVEVFDGHDYSLFDHFGVQKHPVSVAAEMRALRQRTAEPVLAQVR